MIKFMIYVCESIEPIYSKHQFSKKSKISDTIWDLKCYLSKKPKKADVIKEINKNHNLRKKIIKDLWSIRAEGWRYEEKSRSAKTLLLFTNHKKSWEYNRLFNIIEVFFCMKLILERTPTETPAVILDVLDRIDVIYSQASDSESRGEGRKMLIKWILGV